MDLVLTLLAVPLITSVAYFLLSKEPVLGRRVLAASHGMVLLAAMGYAFAASHWSTFGTSDVYIWPFYTLLALFLVAVGYAFVGFKGTRLVHVLQLLQLGSALPLALIGAMAIAHDSI